MINESKIKELRIRNCMSQRELAYKANLSQSTICAYENNKVLNMEDALLKKIAKVFNVDYKELKDYSCTEQYVIGQYIANFRIKKGLNQQFLAELIDTSRGTISRIETGVININDSRYKEIKENLIILCPELSNFIKKYNQYETA